MTRTEKISEAITYAVVIVFAIGIYALVLQIDKQAHMVIFKCQSIYKHPGRSMAQCFTQGQMHTIDLIYT